MRVELSPTEWLHVIGYHAICLSLPVAVAVMACACYWAYVRRIRQPAIEPVETDFTFGPTRWFQPICFRLGNGFLGGPGDYVEISQPAEGTGALEVDMRKASQGE